eukprot:UC1_evm5s2028
MSSDFTSIFVAIFNLAALVGGLISGWLCDHVGKRHTMAVACSLFALGWILMIALPSPDSPSWNGVSDSTSSNIGIIYAMLMASRIFIGLGGGVVGPAVPPYFTEVCPTPLRGTFGAVFQISIVGGIFIAYVVGMVAEWRALAIMNMMIALLGTVLTIMLVETPVWLLEKGRESEARAALKRLRRGSADEIDELFLDVVATVEHQGDQKTRGGIRHLLTDPNSRKALYIGVGLMFVQQFSGVNAVLFYTSTIFNSMGGGTDTADQLATGFEFTEVIITLAALFCMDRFGRRLMLSFAAGGQAIFATLLGASYLIPNAPSALGIVSLYLYVFFFASGMGAVPWTVMGEIFQPSVKGVGSSIVVAANWMFSFIVSYTVPDLRDAFQTAYGPSSDAVPNAGMGGLFLMYGSLSLVGFFWILSAVPETRFKSFSRVQAELSTRPYCGKPTCNTRDGGDPSSSWDDETTVEKYKLGPTESQCKIVTLGPVSDLSFTSTV